MTKGPAMRPAPQQGSEMIPLLVGGLNKPREIEQPGKPLTGAGRAVQCAYFFLGFGEPSTGGRGRWPARSLASRSL